MRVRYYLLEGKLVSVKPRMWGRGLLLTRLFPAEELTQSRGILYFLFVWRHGMVVSSLLTRMTEVADNQGPYCVCTRSLWRDFVLGQSFLGEDKVVEVPRNLVPLYLLAS